jgi:hypothetical protein
VHCYGAGITCIPTAYRGALTCLSLLQLAAQITRSPLCAINPPSPALAGSEYLYTIKFRELFDPPSYSETLKKKGI